ncbi:MAG: amidohydrolase family protein [Deltaproteobacteria bacterium]|jgi:imidazolonepropionase-like amidohydrolase|nr:amidohydrolase family protein [Deltaproteobacteria bacterium]MBW2532656.1 amidohydrolase family protein [Deltaproteobacteria bacterium]
MEARFVAGPRFDRGARVALESCRVLDVEAGSYFPLGVTPIVRGDVVEALVGAPGQPTEVEADLACDLGGRTVMPAMVNTHVHAHVVIPALVSGLGDLRLIRRFAASQIERNMADCLAVGVTHVRDTLVDDRSSGRTLTDRIARGELPGPRLQHCVQVGQLGGAETPEQSWREGLLRRTVGLPYLSYDDPRSGTVTFEANADEESVRAAVDRAVDERGADGIKAYDQTAKRLSYEPGATLMSQRQLDVLVDQARRRGLRVTMHHVSVESFRRGVRAGVSSLAHTAIDEALDDADAMALVDGGVFLEPTLSIGYDLCWRGSSHRFADHPRLAALEMLREQTFRQLVERHFVAELQHAAIAGYRRAKAGHTKLAGVIEVGAAFRHYAGVIGHGIDNARLLYEAGARFGCGNDAGAVPRSPAMVGLELELFERFVGAGDPAARARALRSATIDGAEALGVADRFGSIAPGKVADLVVLDGDPLRDLSMIGRPVAALFMDGQLVVDNCHLADRLQSAAGRVIAGTKAMG